jgi:hypothetical protein
MFRHTGCGCAFHPVLACEDCGEVVQRRDLERAPQEDQMQTVGEALEASRIAAE